VVNPASLSVDPLFDTKFPNAFVVGSTMKTGQQPTISRLRSLAMMGFAWLVLVLISPIALAGPVRSGEQIYRQQCASCHGSSGEGTDEHYPRALVGERSVPGLARLIAKTMPEDAPGDCVGEDADKVAAYIYESFYSKSAQVRNKFQPPRIELSRLTVRQYKNVIADLLGNIQAPARWDDQRGLKAEYSSRSRRRRNGNTGGSSLNRVDPEIHLNFGEGSPIPAQAALKDLAKSWQRAPVLLVPLSAFNAFSQEFRVNWQGSLLAPETGEYEFRVTTENATSLRVNDTVRPLIDALVKSGNDTEYRGSQYLLGGRVYPVRLELSRSKEKTSSIALEWKLPRRAFEVIPRRNLSPSSVPESYILQTPFPPDDRSVGYERGTSVSKAWDQSTTDAALEVAAHVTGHLKELAGVGPDAPDRELKLREFCQRFAERAFRRPLTDEQKTFFIDRQFKETKNAEAAVKRVVLLVLKSPRFLYREIGSKGPDGYDVASRLSFGLWDTLPDQPLLAAAAAGQLSTREQVVRHAERMVGDLHARTKLCELFLQWLKVDQVPDIAKDPKGYPQFNEMIASDLRTSLDLFLEDVIGSDTADFRQLLRADYVYLNGRLAQFYGADLSGDAPFQKVYLDQRERAGVLTHPYLMASFAYTASSSPIHRGVFIARSVLGRVLRPPPEAVAPLAPDLHPDLTTRQRVTLQTKPESCQSCHGMINPLGFTLEHFDAVGRYRKDEKGQSIDETGSYETRAGETVKFAGVRDLAVFLAGSEETHTAIVQQMFHHLVKQPVRAYGPQTLANLRRFFAAHDFNLRKLMVEIMATSALTPAGVKP
jgi:mono/diheme cytochrome c family protein